MADFRKLIPFLDKWEGLWSNDPADRGGATMRGITISTYTAYCLLKGKPKPTEEDLRNITYDEWNDMYKTMFWDMWRADEIESQSVADLLVDFYWNSGNYGIKIPQKVLGVDMDGIVGSKTIAAVNACDPRELHATLKAERLAYVERIVERNKSQAKFLRGWQNRINDLSYSD